MNQLLRASIREGTEDEAVSKTLTLILATLPLSAAYALEPIRAAEPEAQRVASEACGSAPTQICLLELKKICHAHPTFRCYYSFKARLDTVRQVGFTAPREEETE